MKIVIVGGVAAGASAAARARRLNEKAEIVIFERGNHVSFANCGLPYHIGGVIKDRERLLLQTPESLQAALNLDVRVGNEVMAIDRRDRKVRVRKVKTGEEYSESYDTLVLCPGAVPIRPKLPGIESERILVLRNIDDMDRIKAIVDSGAKRVVVIGGGYIGIEMAESLHLRGLKVAVVEMLDQVMPPFDREIARDLEEHMRMHGVDLRLGSAAAGFREADGKITVELTGGGNLEADFVVLSVGVKPDTALAKEAGLEIGSTGGIRVDAHMRTSDPDIYAAGDAVEIEDAVTKQAAVIPLAGPANRQGRIVADNICGRNTACPGTQGSALVKVFDMTGGMTGASEKALKKAKIPYERIYLHPSGHAGYYPGTAPMHMKVLFVPKTGRILGAQVAGFDGVDKRIDVLATAIRAGMTVYDLENLELSYAPPYSSARDPVNMAGFIGANILRGDVDFWYADEYPRVVEGSMVVDVRGPAEFETWHIPGAVNIPLGKIRRSLDKFPRDKNILLYCKVGFRSYLAFRILRQNGYEKIKTLAGGSLTFCSFHGTDPDAKDRKTPLMSYAEEKMAGGSTVAPTGKKVELDCCGLQCPGPVRKLAETLDGMTTGDEVRICATDPGFASDVKAWCKQHNHDLLDVKPAGSRVEVRIRKGVKGQGGVQAACATNKKTMVVFSGDLDKVLAAFVIANGAVSMGSEVTMFFTFWGLNALRKDLPQAGGKSLIDAMFGWMMPKGPGRLKLSQMNMLGAGTAMMKHVMKSKNVDSLPMLIDVAVKAGVKLVACSMSMDVMGLKREELIDGIEIGGVATFLGESEGAGMTLFI